MEQLIRLLGEKYVLKVLESLFEGPKRFSDLRDSCHIDKTLCQKLQRLQEADLVGTEIKVINKRPVVHYNLTNNGRIALRHIVALEKEIEQEQEDKSRSPNKAR